MEELARLIEDHLRAEAEAERLTVLGSADGVWDILLPSYWKESLAVTLRLNERHLYGETFFMRGPEENQADTYRLLLQRNVRSGPWRFCATEEGDVSLVALVPRAAVTEQALDELLGMLLTVTDETYVPYMKLGYEKGLAEQVERGGPGLDQPPPWARG